MCPSVRGQESPTLHDLLSVTVFKRDFAGIWFLSRKMEVPTLLLSNHYSLKTKDCTIISLILISYWKQRIVFQDSCRSVITAANTVWCLRKSWRYNVVKIPKFFSCSFTVSCLDLTFCCISFFALSPQTPPGHFTNSGALPGYPASVSHHSPNSKFNFNASSKIIPSFQIPGSYGPFNQQISPVKIHNPTSYLTPLFLNL